MQNHLIFALFFVNLWIIMVALECPTYKMDEYHKSYREVLNEKNGEIKLVEISSESNQNIATLPPNYLTPNYLKESSCQTNSPSSNLNDIFCTQCRTKACLGFICIKCGASFSKKS